MSNEEIIYRLGSALIIGMVIGFERKLVHKEAGMRTYGILALTCATFMLSAVMIGDNFETEQETWRALAQVLGSVIMGVGFLGVGLIFYSKEDHTRVGLTSAATLLSVAGLGAACGLGFYTIALVGGTMTILTLTVGYYFEYGVLKIFGRDDR